MDIAKVLFKEKRYEDAIKACKDLLLIDGNSFAALKLIAKSFLALKKIDEARIYFNKILNLNPSDFEVIKDLGNSYQTDGDIDKAKEYYRKSISINDSYAPALCNLGSIELNYGNKEEALTLLLRATQSDPKLSTAWSNLANVYIYFDKKEESKIACRRAIDLNPKLFKSHFLLANILITQNNPNEAAPHLRKTIELNPDFPQAYFNLGSVLNDLGEFKEAENYIRKSIDFNPNSSQAQFLLAQNFLRRKKIKEAEDPLRKTIELNPDFANAHLNLGVILKNRGNLQEAEISIRNAVALNPDLAMAHSILGNILIDLGKAEEAETPLRKTIELKPDFFQAYLNLGVVLKDLGKIQEAELLTRKAIELNPDLPEAHLNLGAVLMDLRKFEEAELSVRNAIELNPNIFKTYNLLSSILIVQNKLKEAEYFVRKAIKINSDSAEIHSKLGDILIDLGKEKEGRDEYKKAFDLDPKDLKYYSRYKLYLSAIPFDQKQISEERKEFEKQVDLIAKDKSIVFKGDIFPTNIFYLAYHNRYDDVQILNKLSKALSIKKGIINERFNKKERIKIKNNRRHIILGICSDFLHNHSVSNFFGNVIKDIANTDIEIIIFRGPSAIEDSFSRSIDSIASEVVNLPYSIKDATDIILKKSIDILFYIDVGMSNYTYLLSLSRLALVQFTTLGHPNTSGSPEIDYFISCENYETDYSHEFYSERLIRLSRIPVNYSIPIINRSSFDFSDLNLPEDAFLMGIPHSPFKFHPDFDLVLDKILDEIPNSFLIYADGAKPFQTEQLKNRWSKRTKLIVKRTIFLPRLAFDDFIEIVKRVDIMLDPFYFGMANTFYHSMKFNIPVLTMPTNHIKSRHAFAAYKQMGIKNPPIVYSPDEYIMLCKKLAFDKSYLENIKSEINDHTIDCIFNDKNIYKEYIAFINASLNAAVKNTFLDHNWRPKLIAK